MMIPLMINYDLGSVKKFNSRTLIFKSKFVQKVKNQWTGNDHRVATLPKSYLTIIG